MSKKQTKNTFYNGNPNVKGDGVEQDFSAHEIQEYQKCMNDVGYFCENYVKVISLDEGLVPFKLRGYQKGLMQHYSDNRFSICLSSRQSGKCPQYNTIINIRNKQTNEQESISVGDFFNRAKANLQRNLGADQDKT